MEGTRTGLVQYTQRYYIEYSVAVGSTERSC